jgi:hypothetical protein
MAHSSAEGVRLKIGVPPVVVVVEAEVTMMIVGAGFEIIPVRYPWSPLDWQVHTTLPLYNFQFASPVSLSESENRGTFGSEPLFPDNIVG